MKHDASGNKGMLSCWKCLFEKIGAKTAKNVQKHDFTKNLQVSMGKVMNCSRKYPYPGHPIEGYFKFQES